jgi:hypothetical protein
VTIFTDGPSFRPQQGIGSLSVGLLEQTQTEAASTLHEGPTAQLLGMKELGTALGTSYDIQDPMGNVPSNLYPQAAPPMAPGEDVPMEQARARVKDRGLTIHLPDQPTIKGPALDIMLQRAQDRREREATIARGPSGVIPGALSVGTSFLVGALDPLNVASAFIPVMGEMRYAKLLADAGEAAGARAGVRAMTGAASGAVGMAALQPLDWAAHTQDGQDFGMSDVLRNIMFGAALGGALHPIGGAVSDRLRVAKERPLYPYDLGEPLESHTPYEDVRAKPQAAPDILGEFPGTPAEAKPAPKVETPPKPEPTPVVAALNDLPPRAKEDAMRVAVAAIHAGEPVQVGEMLEAAAKEDPRVAESLQLYHGSPHDFEQFDISKIGTGEGAQAYGHGLYFAEDETVAGHYRTALSIKGYDSGRPFGSSEDNATYVAAGLIDRLGSRDAALAEAEAKAKARPDPFNDLVAGILKSDANIPPLKSGAIYKVGIKANRDHFLDWDKPISEQSPHVRERLMNIANDIVVHDPADRHDIMHAITTDENANTFYERLADALKTMKKSAPDKNGFYQFDHGHKAASVRLSEVGIPGIKYHDAGSRLAKPVLETSPHGDVITSHYPPKTHNFVIFDSKHIEIVEKNGKPFDRKHVEDELKALGETADPKLADRTLEIAKEGGTGDVHVAYERAILEDAQKYEATANARQAHPEIPNDPNAASGDGLGGALNGGQEGRPVEGPRQADGGQPRGNGAANREADFQRLSQSKPEFAEPNVIELSRAAEKLPDPAKASTDERLSAAEKAEAYAKQMFDMFAARLPEEERARLDDKLKELSQGQKDHEDAVKLGASCMYGKGG